MNSDLTYAWQNYFIPDNVYYPSAQVELIDGGIIVYGIKLVESGSVHSFLRKIGIDGNTIWERVYYFQEEIFDNYIYTVNYANDGGFVCAGSAFGEPQNEFGQLSQNFWILKLDSMGCLIAGCDTIGEENPEIPIEINNSSIIIFPNPIVNDAIIQIDLAQLDLNNISYFEIELSDLQGRLLNEFTLDQFHWTLNGDKVIFPLNRGNWANGIYFIQIKAETKIIGNQKIILH